MKNYVISLSTALDRRAHITREFNSKNVSFEFFDALRPNIAEQSIKKIGFKINYEDITGGELACLMSHVTLWQKMIDDNISHMGIFEDDVFLGENSNKVLNSSNWIPEKVDIIKLEHFSQHLLLGHEKYTTVDSNRNLIKLEGKNLGTAGYILSLEGARFYINYLKKLEKLIPLDHIMFEKVVLNSTKEVFQLVPPICIQEMMLVETKKDMNETLTSTLIQERKNRMYNQKTKGFAKFIREYYRLVNQLRELIFSKKVEFK